MNTNTPLQEPTEIAVQMQRLVETVGILDVLLARLSERVVTVVIPTEPRNIAGTTDETQCSTTLGSELQSIRIRIEAMCMNARTLVDTIQL
jgi:hypothetical protein